MFFHLSLDSPFGKILLEAQRDQLIGCRFISKSENFPNETNIPILQTAKKQLEEYFLGKRQNFDINLQPQGTTFQQKVWQALQKIPYGETASYKDVAISINHSKAYRAIGLANNKNPIAIFIPCHRVIGCNGKLVGYAGGLDIKQKLLNLEKQYK